MLTDEQYVAAVAWGRRSSRWAHRCTGLLLFASGGFGTLAALLLLGVATPRVGWGIDAALVLFCWLPAWWCWRRAQRCHEQAMRLWREDR